MEFHNAPKQERPIRLQEYGVDIFSTLLTKSALKKALKKELILVNGNIGTTATFITGGEEIRFKDTEPTSNVRVLKLDLEIVYEDNFLAVVNKPAGILVSGNTFKTVANALAQNLEVSSLPDAVLPQPVHRLDYATTGCLLVGKTSSSIRVLNQLFENRKITKTYMAVTIGKMPPSGTIEAPIDNKEALSEYEVLETRRSKRFGFLNLVKLNPKTGRRHQLRKHVASIGNQILGDRNYGNTEFLLKGKGLYLHASSLEFIHPATNETLLIQIAVPKKFGKLFDVNE